VVSPCAVSRQGNFHNRSLIFCGPLRPSLCWRFRTLGSSGSSRRKGANLRSLSVPADLPRARGDERRITQVLLNLIGNAIKFTDAGEVRLEMAAPDGVFLVSVADTGVGIAEDERPKIFEEFHQAEGFSDWLCWLRDKAIQPTAASDETARVPARR